MPAKAGGTYAGKTAAERVRERRDALLDAAMTLVAQHGWRQLRIDSLCEQARLNRRYFYESFEDLDALAAALLDHLAAGILAAVLQDDKAVPVPELIDVVITALVDHVGEDRRRIQVFGEMSATESAFRYRRQTTDRLTAIFAAEARSLGLGEVDDPVIDLAAALLVNGTLSILIDWADGATELPRDKLIDTLRRLWTTLSLGLINDIHERAGTSFR